MSNRFNVGLISLLVLSACASQDPRQASDEVKQYCASRYEDKRIDPIRDKVLIPIAVDQPQPIEILANRQKANEAEKKALLALSEARNACNTFTESRVGQAPSYRQHTQDRITTSLADLYAGDISFGEFAKGLLFIGERDKLAREDLERAVRQHERFPDLDPWN